jgi:hypothetical protein
MKKNTIENEKRLAELRKEMAALGPVLFGDMSQEANQACSYLEERRRNKITPILISNFHFNIFAV